MDALCRCALGGTQGTVPSMSTRQQRRDGDRRPRRRGKAAPARRAASRVPDVASGPRSSTTTRRPAAAAGQMSELDEGERIRRWRRGAQAAEEVQRQLRAAEGPRPAQAVAECLSALSALEAMGRWPGQRDPISEQLVQEVRQRWARIQRRARAQALQGQTAEDAALKAAIRRAVVRFQADVRRLARRRPHAADSARHSQRRRSAPSWQG